MQADWERDAHGQSSMGYRQFFDAFFELADIWCPDIDGGQYANFLDTLRTRLSVMVVQKKNGNVVRKLVCWAQSTVAAWAAHDCAEHSLCCDVVLCGHRSTCCA